MPNAPTYFPNCFVCGSENPSGLHIPFRRLADGRSRAEYEARPDHVGWPEIIHGGLLFTLMDEAVAWAVIYAGLLAYAVWQALPSQRASALFSRCCICARDNLARAYCASSVERPSG